MAQTAAGIPPFPRGEENNTALEVGFGWATLFVASLTTIARIWLRLYNRNKLRGDDFLIVIALVWGQLLARRVYSMISTDLYARSCNRRIKHSKVSNQ